MSLSHDATRLRLAQNDVKLEMGLELIIKAQADILLASAEIAEAKVEIAKAQADIEKLKPVVEEPIEEPLEP